MRDLEVGPVGHHLCAEFLREFVFLFARKLEPVLTARALADEIAVRGAPPRAFQVDDLVARSLIWRVPNTFCAMVVTMLSMSSIMVSQLPNA